MARLDAAGYSAQTTPGSARQAPSSPEVNMLMVLTQKLQDATNNCEKQKKDIRKMRQVGHVSSF